MACSSFGNLKERLFAIARNGQRFADNLVRFATRAADYLLRAASLAGILGPNSVVVVHCATSRTGRDVHDDRVHLRPVDVAGPSWHCLRFLCVTPACYGSQTLA